jgi:hypothetical protein
MFCLTVTSQIWISRDWTGYHAWEDGRGNYAWDIGALNSNMMSYEVRQQSMTKRTTTHRALEPATSTLRFGTGTFSCQWR